MKKPKKTAGVSNGRFFRNSQLQSLPIEVNQLQIPRYDDQSIHGPAASSSVFFFHLSRHAGGRLFRAVSVFLSSLLTLPFLRGFTESPNGKRKMKVERRVRRQRRERERGTYIPFTRRESFVSRLKSLRFESERNGILSRRSLRLFR